MDLSISLSAVDIEALIVAKAEKDAFRGSATVHVVEGIFIKSRVPVMLDLSLFFIMAACY